MWAIKVEISDDNSINSDIERVFLDVLERYIQLIGSVPPSGYKPLKIIYKEDVPMLYSALDGPIYVMQLNFEGRAYSQAVFQFAHEMCHVYCHDGITNWLIECICEMASLYMLDYLSYKWEVNPPCENWRSYGKLFKKYQQIRLDYCWQEISKYKMTDLQQLIIEQKTNPDPYKRILSCLIAPKLLNLFQNNQLAWKLLPYLHKCCNPHPDDSGNFEEHAILDLQKLLDLVPEDLKKIVAHVIEIIELT